MEYIHQSPLCVMPPVYMLPGLGWRWCKLSDACDIANRLAPHTECGFHGTPEELVRAFAALVRLNRGPAGPDGIQHAAEPRKKMFRYSKDGIGFWGTEVPIGMGEDCPPKSDFRLIPSPYPPDLFVPEGWVIDVLREVSQGAHAAVQHEDGTLLGYRNAHHVRGDFYVIKDARS